MLVGLIDQQRVKIGGQLGGVRQPQFFLDRRATVAIALNLPYPRKLPCLLA
jgi:hypothetical protein